MNWWWPWRLAPLTFVCLIVPALPGCGNSDDPVKITGKLTKNGQPFTVSKDTIVTVMFAPDSDKPGTTYPAKFSRESGTYEVILPPGKYRVRYVIVEKDQQPVSSLPETAKTVHDLTSSKVVDIEITAQ